MATLLDTTILVDVLRDKSRRAFDQLKAAINNEDIFVSRFSELELLSGAKSERDWSQVSEFLARMEIIELGAPGWREAARIYFDLRRRGLTVRNRVDCGIAQVAIERRLALVHNDDDFERIATVRPLQQLRLRTL